MKYSNVFNMLKLNYEKDTSQITSLITRRSSVHQQWCAYQQLKSTRSHAPLRQVYNQNHSMGRELNCTVTEDCITFIVRYYITLTTPLN